MIEFFYLVAGVLLLNMTCGVGLFLWKKDMGVVDIFWATGIVASAWVVYGVSPSSLFALLLVILISCWGLRLAGFLAITRVIVGHRDRRYLTIMDKWPNKKILRSVSHFYMQAAVQLGLCFVLYPIYKGLPNTISWIHVSIILLLILLLIGETIADIQLEQFKRNREKGICQKGLWALCRHPNYFFEISFWFGIGLGMLFYQGWQLALIGPITILVVMRYVTGPYTERLSVEKYGQAYSDYQARVSMIVPSISVFLRRSS